MSSLINTLLNQYDAEVVDEYFERAQPAKTNDRPELNAMLARIKEQRDDLLEGRPLRS